MDPGEPCPAQPSRRGDHEAVNAAIEDALSGIAERPIAADVVSLARRTGPNLLRSLDAIHLATAILVDADVVITYDDRLAEAARRNDVTVLAPSWRRSGALGPRSGGIRCDAPPHSV
jgi:hypothetical protein